jgi:uncharacterized protein (DUF2336 family)
MAATKMDYFKTYPALEGLIDLAHRDGVDINQTLLRVLTDLYVAKPTHSGDEERQYTELALRLLDTVDASTRQRLAIQLAFYAQAPVAILQRLARDEIAVAEPILRYSSKLTGIELQTIAQDASPAHIAALARRESVPLGDQGGIPETTARNYAAAVELDALFRTASGPERRQILLNLDQTTYPPAEPVSPNLANEAVRQLEAAALGHNVQGFTRALARALAISSDHAQRLCADPLGEPLVIAAKALGMPADVMQRILLCLNPIIAQSVQRVLELADLFEELKAEDALRVVAAWRINGERSQATNHQPQYSSEDRSPRTDSAAQRGSGGIEAQHQNAKLKQG